MTHRSMTVAALTNAVVFAIAAASAGAQTRPATTATRPAIAPGVAKTAVHPTLAAPSTSGTSGTNGTSSIMAAGPYKLDLQAQKKNNQTINSSNFISQTTLARSGSGVTITTSDGMALSGVLNGTQLHAAGTTSSGGTLALNGTAAGSGATGTFSAHEGNNTVTGTFALTSGINMGPTTTQKIQNYGDPKKTTGNQGTTCGFWCQLKQWFGL